MHLQRQKVLRLVEPATGRQVIDGRNSANEFILASVTWMPNLHCLHTYSIERRLCVATDRNNSAWFQMLKYPKQQGLAGIAFGVIMGAVRKRFIRFMRMKWKDIPQKDGRIY